MPHLQTIQISCPTCGSDEIEVVVEYYGRHSRATPDSPEEWPDLYVSNELECPNGCIWTALETITLEQVAIEQAAESLLDAMDRENYDPDDQYDHDDHDEEC